MIPHAPVSDLVPHEEPMLAIEELSDWEPGRARVCMSVREDSLFVCDGEVDSVITLEYMAQAVAACLGQEAAGLGEGMRVGMVIACRTMDISQPSMSVGDRLTIKVERVRGTDHVSHFDCETRDSSGDLIASATLTLIHGEKPPD